MREDHTVFGDVEEVVEEMLLPGWGVGGLEAPETAIQEVHVQEGYLGPGCEGWGEAEGWLLEGLVHMFLRDLTAKIVKKCCLLSYHHPVPTPKSSPSFVLGTSAFLSCALGMV